MQHRPDSTSHTDTQQISSTTTLDSNPKLSQHGHASHLLAVPPETLTSITAHLSPPALLALARTASQLAHHVAQDSTWRAAYVLHFLGVSHDSDFDLDDAADKRAILLRRSAPTWRQDFIWRYIMIRRWSRSKNLPVTHTPLMQSPISAMHIMPAPPSPATAAQSSPSSKHANSQPQAAPALLTASTQYGIVARSFPLSGKILPGYLDASAVGARPALGAFGPAGNWGIIGQGNVNHIWNGNPNAHFTPNITACALSSTSLSDRAAEKAANNANSTANIAWGSRTGEVLFTTASKAMDGSSTSRRLTPNANSGVRVSRCAVGEEHEGSVEDIRWINIVDTLSGGEIETSPYAISAGTDGRVKLWDATVSETGAHLCLWSSQMIIQKDRVGIFSDPCVRAEGLIKLDSEGGACHIVGVVQSGDIHVWTGFTLAIDESSPSSRPRACRLSATNVREIVIPRPTSKYSKRNNSAASNASGDVKALSIDPNSDKDIAILIAYEDEPVFYRVRIPGDGHVKDEQIEVTPFGNPNFGNTSVVVPFFARNGRKEASFVLIGDHIGCVSLYAWDAPAPSSSTTRPVAPLRSIEVHRDGASVTALWWDSLLLITGSSRGTTHVWDGMTFEHLRSFVNPIKRVRARDGQPAPNTNGDQGREAVKHILVNQEKDVLIVGIGGVVLAWHAGPISGRNKEKGMGVRGRHAAGTAIGVHGRKRAGGAKHIGPFEMRQAIIETQFLLDHEAETAQRAYGREREHLAGLESLGLSEAEAVEYVLMLSRDEARAAERQRSEGMAEAAEIDQGVFEGDFDDDFDNEEGEGPDLDVFESHSVYSSSGSSSASASSISRSSSSLSGYTTPLRDARPLASQIQPRFQAPSPQMQRHSHSSGRVQVVPSLSHSSSYLHGAEPMEAGEEFFDFEAEAEEASRRRAARDIARETLGNSQIQSEHTFPPMPTPTRASPASSSSLSMSPAAASQGTINSSPKSVKSDSAWTVPLTKRTSFSTSPSTSSGNAWAHGSPVARGLGSVSAAQRANANANVTRSAAPAFDDDMDEDLRFALELSLVEARSRGEDV